MFIQAIRMYQDFSQERDMQGMSGDSKRKELESPNLLARLTLVLSGMLKEHGISLDNFEEVQDIMERLTKKDQDVNAKRKV